MAPGTCRGQRLDLVADPLLDERHLRLQNIDVQAFLGGHPGTGGRPRPGFLEAGQALGPRRVMWFAFDSFGQSGRGGPKARGEFVPAFGDPADFDEPLDPGMGGGTRVVVTTTHRRQHHLDAGRGVGPTSDRLDGFLDQVHRLGRRCSRVLDGSHVDEPRVCPDLFETAPDRPWQAQSREPPVLVVQRRTELKNAVQLLEFLGVPLQPFLEGVLGPDPHVLRPGAVQGRERPGHLHPDEKRVELFDCGRRKLVDADPVEQRLGLFDRFRGERADLGPPVRPRLQLVASGQVLTQTGGHGDARIVPLA